MLLTFKKNYHRGRVHAQQARPRCARDDLQNMQSRAIGLPTLTLPLTPAPLPSLLRAALLPSAYRVITATGMLRPEALESNKASRESKIYMREEHA